MRKAQNIRRFVGARGEPIERDLPIAKVELHHSFRVSARFTERDICGDLLSSLLNVVLDEPEYLRVQDCARHAALIHAFGKFESTFDGKQPSVERTPLKHLPRLLQQWATDAISRESHPLMSSLIADTAHLIQYHAYGKRKYASETHEDVGAWMLEPMLDSSDSYLSILDRRDKMHITQSLEHVLVAIRVPPGVRYTPTHRSLTASIDGPDEIYAFIVRCHLSESIDTTTHYDLIDPTAPRFELMDDFYFLCAYASSDEAKAAERGEDLLLEPTARRARLMVPGHCITAALDPDSRQWLYLPAWKSADFEHGIP